MYEHPYLSYQVTEFEREELVRAAERHRVLIERADQIVPRQVGAVRGAVRRMLGRTGTAADAATARAAAGPSVERRPSGSGEPLTAR
ncbi:hypothetical protein [Microbacterium sp. NPDC087591]|uniref:hypothetical protein n=1 Tax=Microbacterium sp. NPDC087591 TaxID=3364192 RepID=UPI00380F9EBF